MSASSRRVAIDRVGTKVISTTKLPFTPWPRVSGEWETAVFPDPGNVKVRATYTSRAAAEAGHEQIVQAEEREQQVARGGPTELR
jgi:hypothetical protein